MRKFIAACCCVIVGLEVLICIPISLVVAYAYGAASVPTPIVMTAPDEATAVANTASYCTPASTPHSATAAAPYCYPVGSNDSASAYSSAPTNAVPLAYAPSALPVATFNPYVSAPPSPARCPSPAVIPRVELPASPTPLPITAAAIAQQPPVPIAQQIAVDSVPTTGVSSGASGQVSDAAEPATVPATAVAVEEREPTQIAAEEIKLSREDLQQLVRDWHELWSASGALQHVAARFCGGGECEADQAAAADPVAAAKAAQDEAIASMEQTARQLYAEAGRCEERYDFDSADQLRKLARELRTRSMEIQERRLEAESRRRAEEDYLQSPTP